MYLKNMHSLQGVTNALYFKVVSVYFYFNILSLLYQPKAQCYIYIQIYVFNSLIYIYIYIYIYIFITVHLVGPLN